jgi:riboflavin transporter FmnP
MKIHTSALAATATLSAMVVIFDYALKYSNLKIPFPWFPVLKFDFTGIPIVLSFFLLGLIPGAFTSAVAFVAILARSGDFIGSSMKGLAEFSTIIGVAISLRFFGRFKIASFLPFGIISRVLVMIAANLALIYTGIMPLPKSYVDVPLLVAFLLGVFNALQGAISIAGGYFVFEAIKRRAPPLIQRMKSNTQA